VRENLRKAFPLALLSGLLIWSMGCLSAPTAPKAEPPSAPVIPVGGSECKDIGAPILIHRVEPDYPAYVWKQRIEGMVVAEAKIATDGNVENIRVVLSPSEILTSLAIKAFSQWR
jgi:outer membrane biosynthesis protein TonB